MAICKRCGRRIEFRYIDDRCIPLHIDGGCWGEAPEVYSWYTESRESTCFPTTCPECSADVYFIRHNGGSVWLDPPLGYPWPKHPCMDCQLESERRRHLASPVLLRKASSADALMMGVVTACQTSRTKRFSVARFDTGARDTGTLVIKNSGAGFLVGRLGVYDAGRQIVASLDRDDLEFRVVQYVVAPIGDVPQPVISCHECGLTVPPRILFEHFAHRHGFSNARDWPRLSARNNGGRPR
jgi:hypothetical protein